MKPGHNNQQQQFTIYHSPTFDVEVCYVGLRYRWVKFNQYSTKSFDKIPVLKEFSNKTGD